LAAVPALNLGASGATTVDSQISATVSESSRDPIVAIDGGRVRGIALSGGYVFRGLPYAAPPIGRLRWRAPQPPAEWHGVRDATTFAPSCPQALGSFTLGPQDEDCLYLNVVTPRLNDRHRAKDLPVFVWIHGGGFTSGLGAITTLPN
jgi:para-nitrobenzyl esterase